MFSIISFSYNWNSFLLLDYESCTTFSDFQLSDERQLWKCDTVFHSLVPHFSSTKDNKGYWQSLWKRRNIIYETWPPLCLEKKRKKWKLFFSPLQHKHEKHQKINWIDLKLEINWKKRKTWNKLKSTNKKCWKNNFYLFRWQSMNDMFSNNFGWLLFTRVIG